MNDKRQDQDLESLASPASSPDATWWKRLSLRNRVLVVLAVVVGAVALITSAALQPGDYRVSSKWATFTGGSISLSLPDSFHAETLSPAAMDTVFEKAIENYGNALHGPEPQAISQLTELQILLFGAPDRTGFRPSVFGWRFTVPVTVTMQAFLDGYFQGFPASAGIERESTSEDLAAVVVEMPTKQGSKTMSYQRMVFRREGSVMFVVLFTSLEEDKVVLESVFRQSAETVAIAKN